MSDPSAEPTPSSPPQPGGIEGPEQDGAPERSVRSVRPGRAPLPFYLASAVALLLAGWFCVYAFARSPDQADTSPVDDPAIVQQTPAPGSHVLRQTSVGVKLHEGYDGRLTINGTPIPEDQMDGAIPLGAPNYDPTFGVRPNTKSLVFFTPGKGKVIHSFRTGEVNITVRFWLISEGQARSRSVSWAVFVT